MKNVLYIHHTAFLCGASVGLLKIIDNLDKSKYSPSVMLLANGELSEIIRKRGMQVYIS